MYLKCIADREANWARSDGQVKLITVIALDSCKQGSKEYDQIANKFQSDGQPSAQQKIMSLEVKHVNVTYRFAQMLG